MQRENRCTTRQMAIQLQSNFSPRTPKRPCCSNTVPRLYDSMAAPRFARAPSQLQRAKVLLQRLVVISDFGTQCSAAQLLFSRMRVSTA